MAICDELKKLPETFTMTAPVIPLKKEEQEEPLRMAARGGVESQLSGSHKKAIDELFNED